MKIVGGRGKGKGRAQESHRTQDYPYTPALQSRYPTRSFRGAVSKLLALPPSGSVTRYPPLKSALRILRGDRETAEAALPSQPTGDYPVSENGLEDVKPSISAGSPSNSGPSREYEMDLDDLCAKIASQVKEPQQVALQPASHQDLDGNTQPPGENSEVPRDERAQLKIRTTDHVPPSSKCLSPSHSLNMTEFARGLKDELDDDLNEVVSAPGLDYDYVHGRKVKIAIAPLVRAIFEKYGDITKECEVKLQSVLSFFLERVCDVYHRLEEKTLHNLTRAEIDGMVDELHFCTNQKVNVGWLLEKLEEISETQRNLQKYLVVKDDAAECIKANKIIDEDLQRHRVHVGKIQKKMSALEQEKLENQAKVIECTQMATDIKTRAKPFLNQSLVHGLL